MGRARPGVRSEAAAARFVTGGIDVGTASIKTALFVHSFGGVEPLATNLTLVGGLGAPPDHRAALRASWADALDSAGVSDIDVAYVASTGIRDQVAFRVGHFFGRISHAIGTRFLFPQANAFLDCGVRQLRCAVLNDEGRVIRLLARRWESDPVVAAGLVMTMLASLRVAGPLALVGGRTRERAFLQALREGLSNQGSAVRLLAATDGLFVGATGAALLAARRYQRLLGRMAATRVVVSVSGLVRGLN